MRDPKLVKDYQSTCIWMRDCHLYNVCVRDYAKWKKIMNVTLHRFMDLWIYHT